MPGLTGVVTNSRLVENADEISRAIKNVHRVNGITYVHKAYRGNHAVICNVLTGLLESTLDQPASTPSGDILLFMEGEIFNHDELIRFVDSDSATASQCGVLLALFQNYGDSFVSYVNGEFNIVVYQIAEMKVSIYSDHIASMPMYYIKSGERFLFGSEKKSILALLDTSPTINPVGLMQIFAHRHNLEDLTFLNGLKRMMPSTRIVYDRNGLNIHRYELLQFHVPNSVARVDEIVDQWADQLKVATALRLRGKKRLILSLSAGLDSRAVACSIPRSFRPISSRTRGTAGALEPILASEIAARLGFDHFREEPSVSDYSRVIPKIAWRTECEVHFSNGRSLSNHSMIKEYGDFVGGGWLGDASSGAHISPYFLRPSARMDFIERAYRHYLIYSADALSEIFTREFVIETFPKLREAFIASFGSLEAETNIQLFEIWDLYQRQRRMTTSSMPVDSYAFEKVRPFYDRDYLNFTLTLPTRYRFGQTLYQAMICKVGPEIRDIPNANTGLRLHESILRNAMNDVYVLSRKVITKVDERIRPSYSRESRHGLGEDLATSTRRDAGFRRLIEDFMLSRTFDSSIFNRSGISNMLNRHYDESEDRSYELGYVATFAAGLPYLLNKTLRCPPEAEPLL